MFAVPAYPDTKPGPYVSTDQTTTVKATGGDSIEVDNITVTTNANGSHGLYADGGSISGTADVITNRRNSHAVYADNEGTITLTGKIETKGGTSKYPSHGIYANNGSSVVFSGDIIVSGDPSSYGAFADNGSKITLSGSVTTTNTAVQVNGGSKANITSGTKIKTAGSSKVQNGVDANGAGTEAHIGNNVLFDIKTQGLVAANNAKIYASDDIVIKGGSGGIAATSGGQVNVGDGLSVDATHTSVSATYNGKVYIGDNAKISSEHDRGLSVSDGTGSEIHVGNGLHITANASLEGRAISAIGGGKIYISDDATAVVRDGWGIFLDGAESEIRIGDRLTLETAEKSSENKRPAVYVIAGKLFIGDSATINSDNAFGIYSVRGGQVDIGKGLSLDAKHYAIYALNGGTINVGSDARVSADIHAFVASKSGSEIFIGENTEVTAGTLALHALQKGRIQAQDGLSVTVTDAGGIAIAAGEGGVVELGGAKIYAPNKEGFALQAQNNDETGSTTKITGTGLYDIVGRLYAVGDAEINLTMQSGSQLKGASYLSGDALECHRGTIALKMDNAKWELTDDSELTSLTLGDGSQVDFSSLPLGSVLSVGTLSASDTASGVFKMKTDVVNGQGDQLNVTDTSNGSFKILVQNDGAQTTTGKETVTLAQTADNGATFTLANAGETVSLGAYSYILDNFGAGG
ncbi:autotransporter outer membrane beta-barrel domain-containing protein, partial [Synergistaceae bacterium OttesenSCG-928-D05]|nr:autotransporter outer membrane beta-barrel domain-containing protein [Synergistaceae bacterium OttesenSCG-928-D05]